MVLMVALPTKSKPEDYPPIDSSDVPKTFNLEDDHQNVSNSEHKVEEEEVEDGATEVDKRQKQQRAWGSCINEACCDAEAWQNSPLPSSLVKWPSEPGITNVCDPSPGPTCDDFLKQRDGSETLEKGPRVKLPVQTEFQAKIDQPDNMIPIKKPLMAPTFAPKADMMNPQPPRYAARPEYWQAIRSDSWDRAMPRDVVKKPPDVLSDAKAPPKKQIFRKYGKDSDWPQPDEELLELIKTGNLRTELTQPMSGYTGTRRMYCNPCWPRARDDTCSYNDFVYKSSTHLSHRYFPPAAYTSRKCIHGRLGPLSRAVSNLIPAHPFRIYKPERFGRWDTDVPTHPLW